MTVWGCGETLLAKIKTSGILNFAAWGFTKTGGKGELYLEFQEKIYERTLEEILKDMGAVEVQITTFSKDSWATEASHALHYVRTVGVRYDCVGGFLVSATRLF